MYIYIYIYMFANKAPTDIDECACMKQFEGWSSPRQGSPRVPRHGDSHFGRERKIQNRIIYMYTYYYI